MTFVEWLELGATATAYTESDALLPGWIALAGLMLAVSIGMGRGKLWAVRLFRWPSYGAIVRYLPILAAGVLLDARVPHRSIQGSRGRSSGLPSSSCLAYSSSIGR